MCFLVRSGTKQAEIFSNKVGSNSTSVELRKPLAVAYSVGLSCESAIDAQDSRFDLSEAISSRLCVDSENRRGISAFFKN